MEPRTFLYRTQIHRRTLLGSGALVGLGALLAACGQQASNEAAATASAAPSESASASAVASESPSASATPSTVRGYSGGSKAPDGEYRKADGYGPAQNVPKPNAPEEGYNEKSIEGIRKTMDAWVKWTNYGIQVGDFTESRKYISSDFTEELEGYKSFEDLYKRGGWIIDGIDNYTAHTKPWTEDGETYFWKAYREWNYITLVEPTGEWHRDVNIQKDNDTWKFEFKYFDSSWRIVDCVQVDG
ncbi:transposase [Rothia sp. HMSC071B01]|uniref:DUF6318 family protein n=2 Tax=unclassified Rothia (in: high G+C Gram-positive bacteria) TaxID=2689056 RepID=UPI0008A11893|nr:DUF6318 family protein [Rothia sp. HMSC071B01]OFN74638.1 transposase [Rothia sp. HMSC071B01]